LDYNDIIQSNTHKCKKKKKQGLMTTPGHTYIKKKGTNKQKTLDTPFLFLFCFECVFSIKKKNKKTFS